MGAEQSRQNKNSEADKSLEVKEDPCEIILMKKQLELEIDAKYFREKLKDLDTQVGVLKVENTYLKGYMTSLAGKVESLQRENEDFETKTKRLESKTQVSGLIVPPFKLNQPFVNPTSSQIFPKPPFSNAPIESSKNDVTTNKAEYSQGRAVDEKLCPNPLSLLHYDHPLPPELTSLCQVDWCGLCQLRLASQIMANEHYWGRKHFKVVGDYLDKVYSETPELKPKYKPSTTYNRPLPLAVISQCTPNECHLCNLSFAGESDASQEHYYGHQHDKQVLKFLQKNPEHWQEGFRTISKKRSVSPHANCYTTSQSLWYHQNAHAHPMRRTSSDVAPVSWLPPSAQDLPQDVVTQFRQNACQLCSVTLTSEPVARMHYKGKKHTNNVQQLKNIPDGILNISDDIISCDDQVIWSDNNKEVITLSEDCDDLFYNPVFIGYDMSEGDSGFQVQGVTILNHDGQVVFDENVPIKSDERNPADASNTSEVSEFVNFQQRLKNVLENNILIGYDLGKKLKALKMDHPGHLCRDIRSKFSRGWFKPSIEVIVKKCLKISYYQHSREYEAQVTREIYNINRTCWEDAEERKPRGVECRILMPMYIIDNIAELKRKKTTKKEVVGVFLPAYGSVVCFNATDVALVAESLHALLNLVNYGQLVSELKLIVPSMKMQKKDLAEGPNGATVIIHGRLLPNSKERVVGFGGDHHAMVRGVTKCLELMERNGYSYGGPGLRFDCSDHDKESAALYGGWVDGRGEGEAVIEAEYNCCICNALGLENFTWTQLSKGEARKCFSCVSSNKC